MLNKVILIDMLKHAIFKLFLVLFVVFCVINDAYAQVNVRLFYNNNWELTKENSACYYRIGILDTTSYRFSGVFKDYTISDMQIGNGRYDNKNNKTGLFQYFYESGQLMCEGFFDNNIQVKSWTWYYSNGTIKQKILFTENDFDVSEFYDTLGNSKFNMGSFIWSMDFQNSSESKNMEIIGQYKNQKKEGKWKILDDDKNLLAYEIYKEGKYRRSYNKGA